MWGLSSAAAGCEAGHVAKQRRGHLRGLQTRRSQRGEGRGGPACGESWMERRTESTCLLRVPTPPSGAFLGGKAVPTLPSLQVSLAKLKLQTAM